MVVGDVTTGTDLLVIGGGPGGYAAAIRGGQLDLDVTLVEMDAYGGTCLTRGCIPSKAYISATDLAHRAGTAERMGVHADPAVDLSGMRAWKDEVVDQLSTSVERLGKGNGVNLVEGRAEFVDQHRARVAHGGEGQGSESIEFDHAVLATGSRPIELEAVPFDGHGVLSSREVFQLDTVPNRLIVVGAGYIGMELSTVFAKLGSEVTVVELLEDVLPGYQEDISRTVRKRAETLGVEFHFNCTATGWEEAEEGVRLLAESTDDDQVDLEADRILVAVGREPVTDTTNLETLGLEPGDGGAIDTDQQARTAVEHVFAVGDVTGEPMLAHAAYRQGEVAAEVVAGEPAALDYQAIPSVVFTDPEVATVGMTRSEATDAGYDPVTGELPLRASGRALTLGIDEGFVRVVADADTGFILGGQIVGPEASEIIAEVGLAVEMGATLEDVASTVHTHPTLAEAIREAAAAARGTAIHTLDR